MDLVNIFINIGEWSYIILPFLAYLAGFPNLIIASILDFLIINPVLKVGLYKLGLQTSRPICSSLDEGFKCYGLPSGHTQVNWLVLSYLFNHYKKTGEWGALCISLILTLITMWQRWYTGKHTVGQILVGATIGTILGYLTYTISS